MDILCTEYVEREMPQAIISVAPLINGSMARACAAAGIPFYIIPTDLDMRLFVDNLSPDACSTTTILLPFEHQELITQVPHYASWVVNGPVVRSSFFTTYDRAKVREELGIDPNKKMIVAMLGGQGVASASDIVHALSNQNTPCTIATINAPPGTIPSERPHTTITEFSFRTDIARFIKVADLVVTKGGSMSVLEALVSQTPLLLDGTHGMLRWEKFNYRFIEESGYGKQATTLNALSRATEQILSDTFFYEKTPKDLSIDGARALAEKISEKVTQNKAQALSHLQEL
jgi:UDP-N-acetylglucosamine:LPS N-acetylglucosamine transferase